MLFSAIQSALSGMSAASLTIDVAANNLANARTDGFKQSRVVFTTQTPQTLSNGSAPLGINGGSNPVQIGHGVRAADIVTDESQGPLVATETGTRELSNTDVAGNLIDVSLASFGFRANASVARTGSDLLDELTNLRRV